MRILVVEDDRESASWLIKGLTEAGHVANHARDGPEGVALARERLHDVVVMDRMMPQLDGLAAIGMMRAEGIHTPVLILSALCDVDEKVKGLRAGGDDYLAKPYAFTELLARIETLARRRAAVPQPTRLRTGDLEIDLLARTAQRAGKPILLQAREFKLLEYLMRNAGNVVTRTMLLRMSGTTISTPRPMSSMCIFRGCAPRSTRCSPSPYCTRYVVQDTPSVRASLRCDPA